jgi:hypothetical protein
VPGISYSGGVGRDADRQPQTPAERLLRAVDPEPEAGPRPRQLSRQTMSYERTLEGYFAASAPPRWMERVSEVDRGIEREEHRLEKAYRRERNASAGDPEGFAARWRETVERWPFDPELNELIDRHNEWYPMERRLPFDLRTRDYVLVNGQSYRRPVLDAAWALERFPPEL